MLHKHQQGKRGAASLKNTGVADYFAVLGVESFLQGNVNNDENVASFEPSSSFPPSSAANNGSTGVSSESTDDMKNTHLPMEAESSVNDTTTDAPENIPLKGMEKVNIEQGKLCGERKKLEERFQREIVQLALLSSKTGFDFGGWTVIDEDHQSRQHANLPKVPIGVLRREGDLSSCDNMVEHTIYLAYRRRGYFRDETSTAHHDRNHEQSYYSPAISDISIRYAKLKQSTIPLFAHKVAGNQHLPQNSFSPNQPSPPQSQTSSTQLPKSIESAVQAAHAAAHGGAKQLSSFAMRTGLAAAGKEMAMGLANAVNVGRNLPLRKSKNSEGASQLDNPLYDTNNGDRGSFETDLDGNTNYFEDAHGQVPLWRSGSGIDGVGKSAQVVSIGMREHFFPDSPEPDSTGSTENENHDEHDGNAYVEGDDLSSNGIIRKSLVEMLPVPEGFDEWVVPDFCQNLHLPRPEYFCNLMLQRERTDMETNPDTSEAVPRQPILVDRTRVLPSPVGNNFSDTSLPSPSSMGVEAMYLSPSSSVTSPTPGTAKPNNFHAPRHSTLSSDSSSLRSDKRLRMNKIDNPDPRFLPSLISSNALPRNNHPSKAIISDYKEDCDIFVPIIAIRRQRVGEEERFHEDPAVIDILLTSLDSKGNPPDLLELDDDDVEDKGGTQTIYFHGSQGDILKKSNWSPAIDGYNRNTTQQQQGLPIAALKRNIPNGFADLPFVAKVLDRFPKKNYRGMPFPEEELPLFCYAGGSLLIRDKLRNLPLPKPYGFVVKNERGDSIYVSCLSFLEPLTKQREMQLDIISTMRRDVSLPHRLHCKNKLDQIHCQTANFFHLVAFDDLVSFEMKTICLVGRYPYWTEFRRFLAHLQLLSQNSSDIPLERHISHLLFSVPVPKPGGQAILVPLSTMNDPMALVMPPLKDLPLVDLSYNRLFAALDVPTVVTIVLGFLAMEKKVILMSRRQSLVLDCCELLKSLLFPFDLCAPYVPHLTQAFMSCLDFPGAIFVGIYDDDQENGLARIVRANIPEDSIIVELDSGEIHCDGNRYETLKAAYQIIPAEPRSSLIKEVEALCKDAGIIPGQEALDFGLESAIDSMVPLTAEPPNHEYNPRDPLDDRAIRDSFLRFFCSILGGYERFLLVPDADYLISGNDWFDSSKFLSTISPERISYVHSLVETQIFQSFIQRRTESSDVRCQLFDECLAEHHASIVPYGRLGVESDSLAGNRSDDEINGATYHLLVDQCATEPDILLDDDDCSYWARSDANEKWFMHDDDAATQASSGCAESAANSSFDADTPFAVNASGDLVTIPSTSQLPFNARFTYMIDGNPSFPTKFDRALFLPKEPEHLATESYVVPPPILTRSEFEREESVRLYNMCVSRRGPQKQHRCLWQLAKFMGSQFLGAWLMCVPNQLMQPNLTVENKSKIVLRALGALRTLRSHRRIVADEAAYRALIVACGRCGTDRRTELMKLYGLMRADNIFPNAVTLGQYTRAIAEGFSKRNLDDNDLRNKIGTSLAISSEKKCFYNRIDLEDLDANLAQLEESGMKWRSPKNDTAEENTENNTTSQDKTFDTVVTHRSTKTKRAWLPVVCSSSFCPSNCSGSDDCPRKYCRSVRLVAMWSRVSACDSCFYIPLDEEIQGGWDVVHNGVESTTSISCPRCGSSIFPQIAYKEMSVQDALNVDPMGGRKGMDNVADTGATQSVRSKSSNFPNLEVSIIESVDPIDEMPPQLQPTIQKRDDLPFTDDEGLSGTVAYISPQNLRVMLEQVVLEFGEEILTRDRLKTLDPQVFFNLWWYSARFSLPLPLSNSRTSEADSTVSRFENNDYCAFVSWDQSEAMQGCRSAATAIASAENVSDASDRQTREKLFDNPLTETPLLAFFNLQSHSQADWDQSDLSEILVSLVKACDSRDLYPVVECIFNRNAIRHEQKDETDIIRTTASNRCTEVDNSFESAANTSFSMGMFTDSSFSISSTELDCYRTVLYLARYHCTTAFHAFFPTTIKACKGYHFWCAQGTPLPIFDRAFREAAVEYVRRNKLIVPIPDVSDVSLGFRCVFGHLI
ncbi:hypothetical protein ACHAXS_006197 [Conticribra weissflogii]